MQYPHWLMLAGACLVLVGFIGLVFHKNRAEPLGNNRAAKSSAAGGAEGEWGTNGNESTEQKPT
jgi:hypothetical protein